MKIEPKLSLLRSLKDLEGYTVSATNGDVGKVKNFLLDDEHWTVRYLVVDTKSFMDGRDLLITPISFGQTEWSTSRFNVNLTMEKIQHCPSADTDKPVSRQHEEDYARYYGYPTYWGNSGLWGMGAYPSLLNGIEPETTVTKDLERAFYDMHLRSAQEVRGYHVEGTDQAIGHIEDFIVDDETWEIRYLVIDTSNWWFGGKKVLVAPHWASQISWEEKKVYVEMSRESVKNSPEWNPSEPINRDYETHLYDYFRRPAYWAEKEPKK